MGVVRPLLLQLFLATSGLAGKVLTATHLRPMSQLEQHRQLQDPDMTEEERLAYARKVITEVKERLEKQQLQDTTKKEFCKSQMQDLEERIPATEARVKQEKVEKLRIELRLQKCGCCCQERTSIEYELVQAQRDVEHEKKMLKLLDE
eukprot:CAMPEP_0197651028 /NCGR_PEP_ID=MMETSP1338-20131121/31308_1 /TAXON_ID=43686 ORGANISM="Pelagodinium beii, Strain RCC1491" /NCGR_SAMPLE_ID=MMETSP1338 /ASSEMBLY_ACC=CAM_ASM_000754 /LENGTH=147 /DNA_ID=CAMNT_0043225567 /DNA_START=65 /DNA_END=505 /DNA_ORIENTATION=-